VLAAELQPARISEKMHKMKMKVKWIGFIIDLSMM